MILSKDSKKKETGTMTGKKEKSLKQCSRLEFFISGILFRR